MNKYRRRAALLPAALLAFGQAALAQQPPTAGGQFQQIPPSPTLPRAAPDIRIEERTAAPGTPAAAADAVKIVVRSLRIVGSVQYPETELLALTGFTPGAEVTLADLQRMAARITAQYRRDGFFVAQAFLPAQDVTNNAVTIEVSEGRYGNISVNNQARLAAGMALTPISLLRSGDVIQTAPLEHSLLLLSDVPGVLVTSTLAPGTAPGTSDLLVTVNPGPLVSGSIDADNGGNRYTGIYRIGATVNLNNPLGLGDIASLRVLTSGAGMHYARASYQVQAGKAQVGVAYSYFDYALGKEFESLQAHGRADDVSVYGRYPLVRTRDSSLYAQLAFDAKSFRDEVDTVPAVTDKRSRVLTASLYGSSRDDAGGGGMNTYALALATGNLDIETPAARAADALTARTQGHFNKLTFQAARAQRLGGPFSLYASVNGQLASKNLDASEKMGLGGMYAVRAYPEGEGYGDQGYLLAVEGRMDLPNLGTSLPGYAQLFVFADTGSVTINKDPWVAGSNHRSLSGAGVGITWAEAGNFMVRASYAHKLGSAAATSAPDRSGRFWVQLVKYF